MRSPWWESLWWYLTRLGAFMLPICGYFADGLFFPYDELQGKWMPPVPAALVEQHLRWVEVPGPSPFD